MAENGLTVAIYPDPIFRKGIKLFGRQVPPEYARKFRKTYYQSVPDWHQIL